MCGHVGIAGDLKFKDEAIIKRLLLFDYVRGPDSTGLVAIRPHGKFEMAKIASHPLDLFDMSRYKSAANGYQSSAFIGHNRAATKGVVNNYNTHPYHFGNIVGAHNGTLDNDCTKELESILGEKFEVDSMAIFAALDKLGVDETIPLLKGAWSLVWYDFKEKKLNFIRNDKRPMWRAFSKDCKTMFWASEWPIIEAAVRTVGHNSGQSPVTELWSHPEKGFRFMQNTENYLYSYDLDELKKGSAIPPDCKVKLLKGKEAPPVVNNYGVGYDPFGRGTGKTSSTTTSHSCSVPGFKKKETLPKASVVLHLPTSSNDPYGSYLTPEKFGQLAKNGCSWCSTSIEWGDEGVSVWEKDGVILCPECSGGKVTSSTKIHVETFNN